MTDTRQKGFDPQLVPSDAALAFYRNEIVPVLPDTVLDFHTHTWAPECWKEAP